MYRNFTNLDANGNDWRHFDLLGIYEILANFVNTVGGEGLMYFGLGVWYGDERCG